MNRLKSIAIISLVAVVTLGGWISLTSQEYPIEEGSNLFAGSIYTSYRHQLLKFIQSHPGYIKSKHAVKTPYNTKVKDLISIIEAPMGNPQEQRKNHEAFVQVVRELAKEQTKHHFVPIEVNSQRLFKSVVLWIFLKADLMQEMQDFLYQYISPPKDNLFQYLLNAQNVLHGDPRFFGTEHDADYEDPFLHGNLPTKAARLNQVSSTQIIRLGKPLYHFSRTLWWWTTPDVCPEFLLFLQLQPSHFYVNLMKRKGVEGLSSSTLEKLENRLPNFYLITLDKDSSFYWQKKKDYPELQESSLFKNNFLKNLSSKSGHYYWSKHLDSQEWKDQLADIIEQVHQKYFSKKADLNRKERQDFIELSYLVILDTLVEKWSPASMNITCRQGMDRGPSLMVLWMMQKDLLNKQEIATLLLAPPLITRNRSSHLQRIERFISAAERL